MKSDGHFTVRSDRTITQTEASSELPGFMMPPYIYANDIVFFPSDAPSDLRAIYETFHFLYTHTQNIYTAYLRGECTRIEVHKVWGLAAESWVLIVRYEAIDPYRERRTNPSYALTRLWRAIEELCENPTADTLTQFLEARDSVLSFWD